MSVNYLHKRSATANKRPTAASLDIGEIAINYEGGDPGLFIEDDNGDIRKLGPVTVGTTAPNSSPAIGGSTGNSVGEQWLDTTSSGNEVLKIWDGSAWVNSFNSTTSAAGGNDTEVQFNNSGSLDGDANFTFNSADDILSVTEVNGRLDGAVIFIAESGEALSAGDVVYVSGVSGNLPVVSKAQANSSATMPAFGLVQDAAGASGTEVRVTTFGDFTNFDTSTPGWSLGDTLYVSAATAGELTNSAPAGESNLIQNIGKVGRVSTSVGRIKVGGAGRTNATPNLDSGNFFLGNASNQSATVSMSGDATMDNAGAVTIANDAVTTVKILDANVTGAKIEDSVALAGSPTTTTQSAGTNNTTIATTAYADAAAGAKLDPALTSAQIFVGNGSNVATGVAMSGDATIDNTGAVTIATSAVTSDKIADDSIVNADINSAAAIDYSKLASMTSASILVGDSSNVPTVTAVSGDVTLSNTGVVDIIDDVNLGGNPTTTTQADTDNSTRIATTAFVRTRVDNAIQGLDSKKSVRAASTGNLTLSGTQTVDGVALSDGDRILVKDQTDASENGIYVVATGAWARSDDASTWDELVGAFVFVESGTANADSGWVTQTVAGGTLGTDDIPWVQFSGAGQITAGDGMTKTGNTLDVVTADSTRIVVNSDSIDLATTAIAAGTYRSLTIDTYGRATAGTNPTTFAGYGISDTSANLASAITDETGTGSLVFASSPALAGTPTAPTQTAGDNSTAIATTAYVDGAASTVSGTIQWELNGTEIRPTADSRNVVPVTDGGADLGTSSLRWGNVYTQDMHFSNEGTAGNSVDGTTGDWTLQEGADNLYLINNKTGNKFRISMEPVD